MFIGIEMKWSKSEEDVLKKLWIRQDVNKFMIAEILTNRTPSAICKHASELNLKKENIPKINFEKLGEVEIFDV